MGGLKFWILMWRKKRTTRFLHMDLHCYDMFLNYEVMSSSTYGCFQKSGWAPQLIHFNRVGSIIFTIHFGGFPPIFGNTHFSILPLGEVKLESRDPVRETQRIFLLPGIWFYRFEVEVVEGISCKWKLLMGFVFFRNGLLGFEHGHAKVYQISAGPLHTARCWDVGGSKDHLQFQYWNRVDVPRSKQEDFGSWIYKLRWGQKSIFLKRHSHTTNAWWSNQRFAIAMSPRFLHPIATRGGLDADRRCPLLWFWHRGSATLQALQQAVYFLGDCWQFMNEVCPHHDQSAQWCSKFSEPVWPSRMALLQECLRWSAGGCGITYFVETTWSQSQGDFTSIVLGWSMGGQMVLYLIDERSKFQSYTKRLKYAHSWWLLMRVLETERSNIDHRRNEALSWHSAENHLLYLYSLFFTNCEFH